MTGTVTGCCWRANLVALCLSLLLQITHSDFLNSNSLFKLNWAGENIQDLANNAEYIIMTTRDNEKYQCVLPNADSERQQKEVNYRGASATDLIQSVFSKEICTIRIETYWNFELCHGKHIRQYHEEKEAGKETKLLEFYLGKNMKSPGGEEYQLQTQGSLHGTFDDFKIPTILIDGKEMPYYEVIMDDGTPCDLRGDTPRMTRVRYICEPTGRNEMMTIKETSTCEYEAVILTSTLCVHPLYKYREPLISAINCHAMNGAPAKPTGYEELYKSISTMGQYTTLKTESPTKESISPGTQVKSTEAAAKQRLPHPVIIDKQILKDFLNGDYCLHGGQGWWKYEFCYGKYAQQYHVDKKKEGNTVILLGTWNKQAHIKWWKENNKAVGPTSVTHFYGSGDICDLTGKPRIAQVKLKCKEDMQPTAVTIYLAEPRNCEYILGVDSPIICSLLDTVDENGLLHPSEVPDPTTDKTVKP